MNVKQKKNLKRSMAMLNTNQWNEFKESVLKAGFPLDMLDDENREIKRRGALFMDYAEDYLGTEKLETMNNEEVCLASKVYVEETIDPQLKDEDGNDDWYDETYEMWRESFQYSALFHRLIAFEVEQGV